MEIYRDSTTGKVLLPAPPSIQPDDGIIDVRAVDAYGDLIYVFDEVSRTAAGFSVNLPWSLVREDKDFFVDWAFNYTEGNIQSQLNHRDLVSVITPLVPLAEVMQISGFDDVNDVVDLERQVRYAIQTYTGQNFGRCRASIRLRGKGDYTMPLPYPLLDITKATSAATGSLPFGSTSVGEGGWTLNFVEDRYYSIKSAPPEEAIDFYMSTGVLRAPSISRPYFRENEDYIVTGLWGFYDVPTEISTAAKMLIADYSCDESLWRDRYIDSIRAADWRFEFNKQAFAGTGNVQVDHILDSYRRMSMAVV